MKRNYVILASVMVLLAFGLVILPSHGDRKEIDSKALLTAVADKSRYLSADQVTQRIIEKDPTLILVDLRPSQEFRAFALPGAVNIPPDSLLAASTLEILGQPGKDKVLFAASDLLAEKAWLLCSRYAQSRMYVMKGGMNEWFNTIIREGVPAPTASSADLDLLRFRSAARQFFTGDGAEVQAPAAASGSVKVTITRKTPAASGGGC